MKTKPYIHTLLFFVVAGIIAACSGAPKDKSTQLQELKAKQAELSKQIAQLEAEIAGEGPVAETVRSKEVAVRELAARPFEHFVRTQGKVEAEDNIDVSAKSMGVVSKVYVSEGDQVKAGTVLAQIDNGIILKNIDELKSQLDLASTIYERQKNLWDQKIGTEVQYMHAKTNKESLEKRLAALQEQNDMTRIKSPINGAVDEVFLKQGQNVAPGLPAVRVVNFSDLKIKAEVSEAYAMRIAKGDKVVVSLPDLDKEIKATVTFVGKTINPLSRTFTVEARLPSNSNFRPNMTAVLRVVFHTTESALVIPINVVQEINGQKIVYVAEKDGSNMVARKRVVTIDGVYDGQTEVKGLKPGDKLITIGFQGLSDGDFIKI